MFPDGFDLDDPRWTAFLLGELEPAELAACHQFLDQNPAAAASLAPMRRTIEQLASELLAEPCPAMLAAPRQSTAQQLELVQTAPSAKPPKKRKYAAAISVAAVAVLFMAGLLLPSFSTVSDSARHSNDNVFSGPPATGVQSSQQTVNLLASPHVANNGKPYVPSPAMPRVRATNSSVATAPMDAMDPDPFSHQAVLPHGEQLAQPDLATAAYSIIESNPARFLNYNDNPFCNPIDAPLSTFAANVDTASYSMLRRFIRQGQPLQPRGAVRIEELINYFPYDASWAQPEAAPHNHAAPPLALRTELATCPWDRDHRLLKIDLKARDLPGERPASNLVFLLDISGSMNPADRLPMVIQSLKLLLENLTENDRVAIVVYASDVGTRLESTACDAAGKKKILTVLDSLHSGGSTNGGSGIELAYQQARSQFIKEGTNRVILATDGDFNVGVTDTAALLSLIRVQANSGIGLTALGVGDDNINDAMMSTLASQGHGNYYYLDSLKEAQKVLVEQLRGTLHTVAKDVKLQVEFNPAEVQSYRQIGFEDRQLAKEDFSNDEKVGGDVGAGQYVVALYELVPAKAAARHPAVDNLKYQRPVNTTDADHSGELLTVKIRYKEPAEDQSKLLEAPVQDEGKKFAAASNDFRFAAAVAEVGMLLRNSPYKGDATWGSVLETLQGALGNDPGGYRVELLDLLRQFTQQTRTAPATTPEGKLAP
ncbi:MAG TPA: von Willebrand factor type A domain-containing protein [Pirellulales bacterium]|jgi:Ca-activated chloride channel family protein|nr:von Willebrand factor type A domain-containing protein [Pirellulales bacterium]